MGKASDFKKVADLAQKATIDALFQIVLNAASVAAKKNLYQIEFTYPKHQAEALKGLLEKEGFNIICTENLTGLGFSLVVNFSAPTEPQKENSAAV